jgi:hypothetical protein
MLPGMERACCPLRDGPCPGILAPDLSPATRESCPERLGASCRHNPGPRRCCGGSIRGEPVEVVLGRNYVIVSLPTARQAAEIQKPSSRTVPCSASCDPQISTRRVRHLSIFKPPGYGRPPGRRSGCSPPGRPRRESGDPTARNLPISVAIPCRALGLPHGGIRPKCPQHRAGL